MKNAPVPLLATSATSGTVASSGIYLANVYAYSIHGIWGAGGTGTIVIQASNDEVPVSSTASNPATNVINWSPISGGTMTVSGAGSSLLNLDGIGYLWTRALLAITGGTSATVSINYFGKGV